MDSTMNLIKDGLDAASMRGKVISNNIANINTKNYKRFYVTFEENLQQNSNMGIKKTKTKHMDFNKDAGDIQLKRDEVTSMNSDGNNVDLDNEKVNQAANSLMYNALITQANNKLNSTRYVITGGGR